MILKECLRKAKDIIFEAFVGISDTNVQDAIETSYQKGDEALGVANSKMTQTEGDARYLGILAKANDSERLDGKDGSAYVETARISTSVNSTSTTDVSASAATKTTYDHAQSAHSQIAIKDIEYNAAFEKLNNRNQNNGYAGLDSAGFLSPNQIPGQTIVNVYTYTSIAERNAFTGHHQGDMAIIEEEGTASLFILKNEPAGSATTDDDWLILQTNVTVDVHSWNTRNGDVMPALGDYSTALVLHEGAKLDGYLKGLDSSIPRTAGDLDAYDKSESDLRFVNETNISDAINSNSSTNVASSKAAKTAYDRGTTALNTANSKLSEDEADLLYLGITAKATDSDKLDGKVSTAFLLTTGKAADSSLLNGNNESYYRNASNLNSGTVPNARLPSTATRSDNDIKDIAGTLANGSQTRISVNYNSSNKTYTFNASLQSDNNFTNSHKSKLDNLLPNAWEVVTGHTNVTSGDRIIIDMESIGEAVVTLPASPTASDTVMVADGSGLAGQGKAITIARNGNPIMSLDEDMNVDVPGYLMTMVYLNNTRGWVVMN